MRKNTGYYVIFLSVVVTIFLWLLPKNITSIFSNSQMLFTTLGQFMALIGITLFGINFVLITRIRFLEDLFGGIDKVYRAHHINGGLAFIFLLLHPLFLTLSYYLFSSQVAFEFLFLPSAEMAVNWGKLALGLMSVLLIITFYINLPYHIWKFTHKFMGVAFFLGVLHMLLIPSDVSINLPLRYWLIGVLFLGLTSYIYKTLLGKSLLSKLSYKVKDVQRLSDVTWEIVLDPVDKKLTFIPGQFCFLEFENKQVGTESHPFSISSSVDDNYLKFIVKDLGDFTHRLANLKLGDKVKVEGAYGGFRFSNHYKKQIWIAGGIGITPFLSMFESIKPDQQVDLYYSVGDETDFIHLKEVEKFATNNKNFRLIKWVSKTQGRLSAETISTQSTDIKNQIIYICGPTQMMNAIRSQFENVGVKGRQIRMEEFELI